MLAFLGAATIIVLLALILFRITSVVVALTLVPVVAGLLGGAGLEVGTFAVVGIQNVAPTAALLAFSVLFFGVMTDAGLFDPLVRALLRFGGGDPLRIVLGTAVLAAAAQLDGAGATTFLVTVPAMLPLYRRLGMDPLVLTCTTALASGTLNILPWGGPTGRAATVMQTDMSTLFSPLLPAVGVGIVAVFASAAWLGFGERKRLASHRRAPADAVTVLSTVEPSDRGSDASDRTAGRATGQPGARVEREGSSVGRWWFNAALTVVTLVVLLAAVLPLAVIFMIAFAVALLVNHPRADEQRQRLMAHGSEAALMVTTVMAAGMFTGIMTKSGMLSALATAIVAALPTSMLGHLPVIVGILSMPLSLVFDPDSYYFGVLPILASASDAAGVPGIEVARASLLGQMTTGYPVSPLTPATFLLMALASVDLADHQRRTIPYAFGVTVVMTLVAVATSALRL